MRLRNVMPHTSPMDPTELAWAAGFWDGEGWANLVRCGRGELVRPMGRINQSDVLGVPVALARFRNATGLGTVSGPHLQNGREPIYRWVISSRPDVERLGQLLGPWLGDVKRRQLEQSTGARLEHASWSDLTPNERRAWGAGLWDGEGSVCLLRHRTHDGYFVPEASVTQSSDQGVPEVLMRLGSIGPPGFVYGPFPQEQPYLPVYRWK
ncbi:MAG: hypothetical protein HYY42_01190, partial [Chloroflexi bacterium]|nr:hypothetical protein [Chloroflexota bacterium]